MNLKRFTWGVLAACSLAGCGPVSDSPIRFLNAAALDSTCEPIAKMYVKQGSLNLASMPVGTREVSWPFYVESNLAPVGSTGTGNELRDFIAEQIELSYRLEPAVGALQPATVPVYAVLRVGSSEESTMNIPLLPSQALSELTGLGLDSTGAVLFVTFTVRGHTAGGMAVASSPVTYPIEVYSLANCTADASCSALNALQTCQ